MSDHDALLRAIGEHPEEDTPRLMYADWLEENDQPERADFVRNQIELAQVGLNSPDRSPLVRKNVRYLLDYVPYWKSLLPQIPGIEWGDFNRGLIEEVQAQSQHAIIEHSRTIFSVPGIHILRLRWLDNGRKLARVPELALLRSLRLVAGRATGANLNDLLASEFLGKLTHLDLHGNAAGDSTAELLASDRFPNLAELWLGSNTISSRGGRYFADSQSLELLRLLDLRNNAINDNAVRVALLTRFGSYVKL